MQDGFPDPSRSVAGLEDPSDAVCDCSDMMVPLTMTRGYRRQLLAVLAVALMLRLAAGWAWQARLQQRFGMGDSETYSGARAGHRRRAAVRVYGDTAQVFRTPGYPLLLAPILWLAGDGNGAVLLARAEAALLGTLAVLGVWWLTRLLFDDRAAMLAGVLAAIYPGAIAINAMILSEAPLCPLLLLQLAFWTMAWCSTTWRRHGALAFCGGLAAGAATLMRPDWLLFTPFALAVGVVLGKRNAPATPCGDRLTPDWAIATAMIFGLVMAMLPWSIRNAYVTGHFVPTTLQVGASLYDGLNPDATGASNMDFVPRFVAVERRRADTAGGGRFARTAARPASAGRSPRLGPRESRPRRAIGGRQVPADVEYLAE